MADWTLPFTASYRFMRVSRATGMETGRIDGVMSGGTIERNLDSDCKESGSITAVDWTGIGADLVRIWLDARFEDGAVESAALGTFLPSTSSREIGGPARTSDVSLVGRIRELADDMFGQAFSIAPGTNAVQYAAEICRDAGLQVVADASDYVLPERTYYGISADSDYGGDGETRLSVINDLLSRAGFESARTDPMGRVLMRRYAEPADRMPSAMFEEGASARFLREMEDGRDTSGVVNTVYAVYSGDAGGTGVVGSAVDDSGGQWSVQSMGRVVARKESYSETATQAQADAKAAELLRTSQAVKRTLNISHVYSPATIGDTVEVRYPSQGISGRYAIRRQSLTLGAGCLTESEVRMYER